MTNLHLNQFGFYFVPNFVFRSPKNKSMFDKFTEKARQAVLKAQEYVRSKQQQDVQIAHLLKGMLEVDESVVAYILKKLGVNLTELNSKLDSIMETYPKVFGSNNLGSHLSKEASLVIQNAQNLAKEFHDEFVAVDMILAGIFSVDDKTTKLLRSLGVNEKELGNVIKELRKGRPVQSESAENEFNALNKYAVNLNDQARQGKLDRIIGRDDEIRRVLHILSRRKKNNPILRC